MRADDRHAGAANVALADYPLGYCPGSAGFDEMVSPDGRMRDHWQGLANSLLNDRTDYPDRFGRAERYLRDAGIFHRDYGDTGKGLRSWPLSAFPVLLTRHEFDSIAAGLAERADFLEQVMADLYGNNRLIAEGLLPPRAIAANPEFLRPLVGVKPAGGHYLHFCAFDLGRDASGRFKVLADRTQAPSGAGFALENRVATARAFAGIHDRSAVTRLSPFFQQFRDSLEAGLDAEDERVAVLTPGRANPTYFEQAYLARYLGFTLLEGEDLVVIDGVLMVRTISGPKPVSVLWRRQHAALTDPLELDESASGGTPGLMEAIRAGSVKMVNAAGSGLLETGILAAHLPAIARHLARGELKLDMVETLWGGGPRPLPHQGFAIGPAFASLPHFERNSLYAHATPAVFDGNPDRVARAIPVLSRVPLLQGGKLVPRPLILRFFAARTGNGWAVMPGGFARLAAGDGADLLAFHQGGNSADLWIVNPDHPPAANPPVVSSPPEVHRQAGNLPSRAADNLFWLGRYIERAEGALRILRAYHARLAETGSRQLPLLLSLSAYLKELDIDTGDAVPAMLLANIDSAVYAAGNIRDRFSPDGWMALTDLQKTAHRFADTVADGDDAAHAMTILLRKLAGFAGLVHENMYRFMGWRFLILGRHLERGLHMTRLLAHFTAQNESGAWAVPGATGVPDGADDLLLDIGDNVMTHRRHYSVTTSSASVIDLMGLDPFNPRSVAFQLTEIAGTVAQLPEGGDDRLMLRQNALAIAQSLSGPRAVRLTSERFRSLESDLEAFADHLALAYLS
nr:circularly permuted type 2 ATP-grasp protein [uncultured Gellertiella sp.]